VSLGYPSFSLLSLWVLLFLTSFSFLPRFLPRVQGPLDGVQLLMTNLSLFGNLGLFFSLLFIMAPLHSPKGPCLLHRSAGGSFFIYSILVFFFLPNASIRAKVRSLSPGTPSPLSRAPGSRPLPMSGINFFWRFFVLFVFRPRGLNNPQTSSPSPASLCRTPIAASVSLLLEIAVRSRRCPSCF